MLRGLWGVPGSPVTPAELPCPALLCRLSLRNWPLSPSLCCYPGSIVGTGDSHAGFAGALTLTRSCRVRGLRSYLAATYHLHSPTKCPGPAEPQSRVARGESRRL